MIFAELLLYNWKGNETLPFQNKPVILEFLLFRATEMDLKGSGSVPDIARCFLEAPGSGRVAAPSSWILCFSLHLDCRVSCQAQCHRSARVESIQSPYLELTMGCQTPVLCGILLVKAIPLGPWDANTSILIETSLQSHTTSHLWKMSRKVTRTTVATGDSIQLWQLVWKPLMYTILTWNSIKSSIKELYCSCNTTPQEINWCKSFGANQTHSTV